MEFPRLEKEAITHTQLVKYAGASGDFNPIHTVVPIGEKAGLGGVIAHGMLIMGFAGQAITTWFPRKDLTSFRVRFIEKTKPGEKITIEGSVKKKMEDQWVCEIVATNQHGERKLKGEFTVLSPSR